MNFARHGGFQWQFQIFARAFHGVFELHVAGINVINASQRSSIVELRLFKKPNVAFLFVELLFDTLDQTSGHKESGLDVA